MDLSRRTTLLGAMAAAGCATTESVSGDPTLDAHRRDWEWLVGAWTVEHRRLKARLAGSTEWEEFNGASRLWLTMNGLGTVDDNLLEIPSGTYRAMGVRGFDREKREWAIWWLDERYPGSLGEPVRGGFSGDTGVFTGDDTLNDRPIKDRFRWTDIHSAHPRWEQAFSPDGGTSWEVNWEMRFTRAAQAG